jgi:UDP-2,3-diacylglucosamine hydrolase
VAKGRLGIVAGGGGLPLELARACSDANRAVYIIRLKGMAAAELAQWPGEEVDLAKLGRMIELLRTARCTGVTFAGKVERPDFTALKPDMVGIKALPRVLAAARKGDDALLRVLLRIFEDEGFRVEGADEAAGGLTLAAGPLGRRAPGDLHWADLERAAEVARRIGEFDIGQAVVVCRGLVLAVEAQEGTAAMLERCAALPAQLRGSDAERRGVLVKLPKPIQDRRVDLPTIGPRTLELAARAGLAGVAGEAGGLLVVERDAVRRLADRLGLFVYGLPGGD